MPRVKMNRNQRGSEDGLTSKMHEKGKIYDVGDSLAKQWCDGDDPIAKRSKQTADKPEPTIGEKTEAAEKAKEDKAAKGGDEDKAD